MNIIRPLTICLFMFGVILCEATAQTLQWNQVVPASSGQGNYRPRVAVLRDGSPIVCWGNQTTGKVKFTKFSGGVFQSPISLNPAGTNAYIQDWTGPDMAVKGDTIYVVFKLTPEATAGIYLVRSTDGGNSFSDTIRIDPANGNIPWLPSVSVNRQGDPIVVYMDNDAGWADPRYVTARGVNLGNSFMLPVEATKNIAPGEVCDCCPATLLIRDSLQLVLFRNNQSNLRTIFGSKSEDHGDTYISSDAVDVTGSVSSQCQSTGPDGVLYNDSLYTVWRGNSSGLRIYISSTGLQSLAPVVHKKVSATIPSTAVQNYPKIAIEGPVSVLTWQETYSANAEVLFSFNASGEPSKLGLWRDTVNTSHAGGQVNPDVAVMNSTAHIVWQDIPTGNVLYRSVTITPVVSGIRKNDHASVSVSPNPFNEEIKLSGLNAGDQYQLVNSAGQAVLQQTLFSDHDNINTSALSAGTYYIHVQSGGSVKTITLVKQEASR